MKFHWGHGITVAIICFMVFILFMVFQAFQTNTDLYAVNYYEQEINYQQKIDGKKNASIYFDSFLISIHSKEIQIEYPKELDIKSFVGNILFYKPNNAQLDRKFIMEAENHVQKIQRSKFTYGKYSVQWSWSQGGKPFFIEKELMIP